MRAQGEWRGAGRRFLHRPHASQHPSVAERPSAQVLNVDDDLGCSNARRSLSMLVILSSIVSMPELAAAQSFVASTIIVSRARRMRAARCLQSRPPMLPMLRARGGASTGWWWRGGRRCHRAATGELGYLLRNSFSSNDFALCSLWSSGFLD